MEEVKVKLPIKLGLKISKILKEKYGIEPHRNSQGILDCTFTDEELALITRLKIDEPTRGILEGISQLPNLKYLEVVSKQRTEYTHPKDISSIGKEDKIGMADKIDVSNMEVFEIPTDRYHSILCIDDYFCLYDDPCWNAVCYQRGDKSMPWILKTHSEISKDHSLSFEERGISNNHLKTSPERIKIARERYQLYQTRTDSATKSTGQKVLQSAVKATEVRTRTGEINDAVANIADIERSKKQEHDVKGLPQEL